MGKQTNILLWFKHLGVWISWSWEKILDYPSGPDLIMCVHAKSLQLCPLFVTLWTVAYQAPLSLRFSRQEFWNDLYALLQEIFLTQGSNPCLLHLLHWEVSSLPLVSLGKPNMITMSLIRGTEKESESVEMVTLSRDWMLKFRNGSTST